MLASLVLLAAGLAPVARAANATVFPVGLGPGASLQGEVVGTGGEVGTTYILSGETSGIAFTLTLAEDASRVAEHVAIPTLSFDLDIGCVVSGNSAICENVQGTGTAAITLPPTTLPFSPFAVAVSTGSFAASTSSPSASGSASTTVATSTSASHSVTILSSVTPSTTVAVTSSTSLTSPSASQSPTSGASRITIANVFTLFTMAAAFWILT